MSKTQVARRLRHTAHLVGDTIQYDRVARPPELPPEFWSDLALVGGDSSLVEMAGLAGPLGQGFSDPLADWQELAADCRAILRASLGNAEHLPAGFADSLGEFEDLGAIATRLVQSGHVVLVPAGHAGFYVGGAGKRGGTLAMALDSAARFPVYSLCEQCGRVIANQKKPRTYCGAACRKAAHVQSKAFNEGESA